MTKKIAISIPDDVAERLAAGDIENVSAYVTEAVRRQIVVEKVRKMVADSGIQVTEEGLAHWRRVLAEKRASTTPEMWEAARQHFRQVTSGGEQP